MPDGSPADLLNGLCVPRISYAVCKQAGIPLRGEKNRDLTDSDLRHIAKSASSYRIQAIGTEGFDKAQVMAGGLNCEEINPENLESMLSPGLHVTGELLNVDGDCGGYNMMFACMSGIKAGCNCRRKGNS